ncbi:hypothetical protein WKH50_03430 [Pantoea agglomerans]|uniref:hypothetical protein n=1 Tax=Enterobacter agglomerans TaxID=549 RepID=UPI003C7E9CBB
MEGHHFERLKEHILSLSVSDSFAVACNEWELDTIELSEEWDNCPCGQDIKEHCYIRNKINNNTTYVGNQCIKRFMNKNEDSLFDGLKRIKDDLKANANQAVIDYAYKKGFIYDEKEYNFLVSTKNKRKLTPGQIGWKEKVNRRILNGTVVKRRTIR